ncbi:cadherin-like domain-containing protein [Halomonas sp. GD1P12]|uniref:cadherin-like domain-containing protein n=1 Tax=Halomonas sp. GD1P12 TaxID=2982691 RepID=UPI0021E4642D|nr:cadherin-like domain-containing protein [Halomonas sp. GD1P12]UYF98750.1 hypothetical protein OCT39_10955 [Halomonas sp. GD1P12]
MNDLIITQPQAFHYNETSSGDVDAYAARTDAFGQPTLAAWRLDHAGSNSWTGSLASGGPNDSSDAFVFEVPQGREVQGISLSISNVQINSGSTFFLSTLDGQWWTERPLTSFNDPLLLKPGQYSLMMGNGTLVLDYELNLNVVSTQMNTAPTLDANPRHHVDAHNNAFLFSDVTAKTNDPNQYFTQLEFHVAGVKDGALEVLTLSGVDIPLTPGALGVFGTGHYQVLNDIDGISVQLNHQTMDESALSNLVAGARYQHTGDAPTGGNREITLVSITDNGADHNFTPLDITTSFAVQGVAQPPVLLPGIEHFTFIEKGLPQLIDPFLMLIDTDSPTLASATIKIINGFTPGDMLLMQPFPLAPFGTIQAAFNAQTGVLTLTSLEVTTTVVQWQEALRAVAYSNLSHSLVSGKRVFEFSVSDGQNVSQTVTQSLSVQAVNDAPKLAINTGASVAAGTSVVLDEKMLGAVDVDDAPEGLTYTLKLAPLDGTLMLDALVLKEGDTFTQADINAGKVRFEAGSKPGVHAMTFSLADGGEDGVLPITGQTFAFTVAAAPVTPGPAPAPVPVTPPASNWLEPITRQPLSDTASGESALREVIVNRAGQDGALRLVENSGSANVVTATLPGGATLTHEGARSAITLGAAQVDLVAALSQKAPANQGLQAELATLWLSSRADASMIDLRTLSFSAASELGSSIKLTGEPSPLLNAAKAFVIDTTGLPGGARIDLENIEFVSLKGGARITAGAGDSVIIADDAPVQVTLGEGRGIVVGGAGDDVLIGGSAANYLEGGEGNNRFYTKGGNDTLVGGSGVDTARFDSSFEAAALARDEDGRLVVTADGAGRNTLVNVELLRFDDQVVLVDDPTLADADIVLFDEALYLSRNDDVAQAVVRGEYASGREHFDRFGVFEGRSSASDADTANMAFDEAFYLAHNLDVAAAVAQGVFTSAFEHYARFGEQEGRNPNVLFDERAYRAANVDVDAAIEQGLFESAYMHYRLAGESEGRTPSSWFDLAAYKEANADVVAANVGVLSHYFEYGRAEGRLISAIDDGFWG